MKVEIGKLATVAAGTKSIADVVIPPFDTTLTSRGFFGLYEHFLKESKTSEDAYYMVEDYCMENQIAIRYTTFISFRTSYYRFLDKRK